MDRAELKMRLSRLGLSLRAFAAWVDMNEDTVYHWVDVPRWASLLVIVREENQRLVKKVMEGS